MPMLMEMERGKCVIASATSILKSEDESKGTISAIVRKSLHSIVDVHVNKGAREPL